jgi:hypothetical protein
MNMYPTVKVYCSGSVFVDLFDDLREVLVRQVGLQLQQDPLQRLYRQEAVVCGFGESI